MLDDESESESDIKKLLLKFQGNWKVVKEPVTNPHAMPFMCYLLDKTSGKKVEIHSHKQKVQSVSKWNPKVKLAKENLPGEKPVFCVGNSCSSVSEDSKSKWQHNHCQWLEAMLRITP